MLSSVVLVALLVEGVARYAVPKISRVEGRTVGELRSAGFAKPTQGQAGVLVFAGNSLLLESVSMVELNGMLRPDWHVQRAAVENTSYLDWYFGIKHLLEQGSRPQAILLMLSPEQLVNDTTRGAYSAHRLFSAVDSIRVGMQTHTSLTEVSNLWFSHWSSYYGLRYELRQQVLRLFGPGLGELQQSFALDARPRLTADAASYERIAGERFSQLRTLCDAFRTRCLFVCAPLRGDGEERAAVLRAADAAALSASDLNIELPWQDEDFQADGFHMSADGAAKYTAALGAALTKVLAKHPQIE